MFLCRKVKVALALSTTIFSVQKEEQQIYNLTSNLANDTSYFFKLMLAFAYLWQCEFHCILNYSCALPLIIKRELVQ